MTPKELSRQWRMLETAYDRILKQVRDLNMEPAATDDIADILSAQKLLHRQAIAGGLVMFAEKASDKDIAELKSGKVHFETDEVVTGSLPINNGMETEK